MADETSILTDLPLLAQTVGDSSSADDAMVADYQNMTDFGFAAKYGVDALRSMRAQDRQAYQHQADIASSEARDWSQATREFLANGYTRRSVRV